MEVSSPKELSWQVNLYRGYIAICHPSKVRTLCTRKRATVVVCVLAVGTLPLYILSAAATGKSLPP